ncbi:autophagy-related protein 22-like, partial [Kipferlia bialata]
VDSTIYLAYSTSITNALVAVMSPVLGTISDHYQSKKLFLGVLTACGVLSCIGCSLLPPDNLWPACAIYVVGLFGFHAANIFYDALLPGIVSSNEQADNVSAMGFALGYIGGGLQFLVCVILYLVLENTNMAVKISFAFTAVWWALFTLPLLLNVPEIGPPEVSVSDSKCDTEKGPSFGAVLKFSIVEVVDTFKQVKILSNCALFLAAYFMYIDGADTIISMALDLGMSLGFPPESLVVILLMVQFLGMPMTLLFTKLVSKIGPKNGVLVCCGVYLGVVVLGTVMTDIAGFYALAALVSCVQGPIQALSRSLFTRLVPADSEGRFFGLYNIIGKFSTIIGPLLIGTITSITGSTRLSVASLSCMYLL